MSLNTLMCMYLTVGRTIVSYKIIVVFMVICTLVQQANILKPTLHPSEDHSFFTRSQYMHTGVPGTKMHPTKFYKKVKLFYEYCLQAYYQILTL